MKQFKEHFKKVDFARSQTVNTKAQAIINPHEETFFDAQEPETNKPSQLQTVFKCMVDSLMKQDLTDDKFSHIADRLISGHRQNGDYKLIKELLSLELYEEFERCRKLLPCANPNRNSGRTRSPTPPPPRDKTDNSKDDKINSTTQSTMSGTSNNNDKQALPKQHNNATQLDNKRVQFISSKPGEEFLAALAMINEDFPMGTL